MLNISWGSAMVMEWLALRDWQCFKHKPIPEGSRKCTVAECRTHSPPYQYCRVLSPTSWLCSKNSWHWKLAHLPTIWVRLEPMLLLLSGTGRAERWKTLPQVLHVWLGMASCFMSATAGCSAPGPLRPLSSRSPSFQRCHSFEHFLPD